MGDQNSSSIGKGAGQDAVVQEMVTDIRVDSTEWIV